MTQTYRILPTGMRPLSGGRGIPRPRVVALPRQGIPSTAVRPGVASAGAATTPLVLTPWGQIGLARLPRASLFNIGFVGMGLILVVFGLAGLVSSGAKAALGSDVVGAVGPAVAGAINPVAGVAASIVTSAAKSGKSGKRAAARGLAGLVKKAARKSGGK